MVFATLEPMLRAEMVAGVLGLLVLSGCGGGADVDGGADAGGLDAGGLDAGGLDAGRDDGGRVDVATDARHETVLLRNTNTCFYSDYGSPCRVTCDLAPDVPITLTVTWSGPYCCVFGVGAPQETFPDCRCLEGEVRCPRGPDFFTIPTSTCEFCPGTPSGSLGGRGDSGSTDAAVMDAHSDDAGVMEDAAAGDDAR